MADRLDLALTVRGHATSRAAAAKLIAAGRVRVDGQLIRKPATRIAESAVLEVVATEHYVSRAAHKLAAALAAFPIAVAGRTALDVGASTGGFSQVLLEAGAAVVIAVDVGHGQLHPRIAAADRLRSFEGVNARFLTVAKLQELMGQDLPGHEIRPDLVVADLSFISLPLVLPALRSLATSDADFVMLVKPQFEVGRGGIRGGIVRDPNLRAQAVHGVLTAAGALGLGAAGVIASPLAGASGNREYLVWLSAPHGSAPGSWQAQVRLLTAAP